MISIDRILKAYTKVVERILKENKDYAILLLGFRRVGKSTLALYIAQKLHENTGRTVYLIPPGVNPAKISFKRNSIIILDEMMEVAYSREFRTKKQISVLKTLNLLGAENHFIIATVQDVRYIDISLRTSNFFKEVYLLYDRGKAVWFGPPRWVGDKGSAPYIFKRWNDFEFYYDFIRPYTIHSFLEEFPASIVRWDLKDFDQEKKYIVVPGLDEEISYKDYLQKRIEYVAIKKKMESKELLEELKEKILRNIDNEKALRKVIIKYYLLLKNRYKNINVKEEIKKILKEVASMEDEAIDFVDRLFKP